MAVDPIIIPVEIDEGDLDDIRSDVTRAMGLVAAAVGIAVAAFETLQFAIEGSERLTIQLTRATGGLNAVLEELQGNLAGVAEELTDTNSLFTILFDGFIDFARFLPGAGKAIGAFDLATGLLKETFEETFQAGAELAEQFLLFGRAENDFRLQQVARRGRIEQLVGLTREENDALAENADRLRITLRLQGQIIERARERFAEEERLLQQAFLIAGTSEGRRQAEEALVDLQIRRIEGLQFLGAQERELFNRLNENQTRLDALASTIVDKVLPAFKSENEFLFDINKELARQITLQDQLANAQLRRITDISGLEELAFKQFQEGQRRKAETALLVAGTIVQAGVLLFEDSKALQAALVIINTARAIATALPNIPLSITVGAIGAAQLAKILLTNIGSTSAPAASTGEGAGGSTLTTAIAQPAPGPIAALQQANIASQLSATFGSAAPPQNVLVLEDLDKAEQGVRVQEDLSTLGG